MTDQNPSKGNRIAAVARLKLWVKLVSSRLKPLVCPPVTAVKNYCLALGGLIKKQKEAQAPGADAAA
jgi:hypothetical protein